MVKGISSAKTHPLKLCTAIYMTFSVLEKNKSQVELYRINNRNELNTVFILILMQFLFQKKKKKKKKEKKSNMAASFLD